MKSFALMAKLFVKAGANVNTKDSKGFTPLDVAVYFFPEQKKQAKLEIADMLRQNGGKHGQDIN